MADHSILWRRLDLPGHEAARLSSHGALWHLEGTAVFARDGQPCRLAYRVICDNVWQTRSGSISGWIGDQSIDIEISVGADGRWWMNETECPRVEGCIDLDLNFSPSTNLLPIRRLALTVGEQAVVRAAWLRFPSFVLEPLEQRYHRLDASIYRYESAGGQFVAELNVDDSGFVTDYPNIWKAEAPV